MYTVKPCSKTKKNTVLSKVIVTLDFLRYTVLDIEALAGIKRYTVLDSALDRLTFWVDNKMDRC